MQEQAKPITVPNNVSSRCRDLLLKLKHRLGDPFGSAFAYALGIEGYNATNPDHKDLVRTGMSEFRKQINSIINELERTNCIAPELYAPMLGAKDILGAIDQLDGSTVHYPQLTDEKVALTFGWAACVLEIENEDIDYDLVSEILSDLMTLKTKMNTTTLPVETRILFKRLIDSLERATIEANFTGMQSIKRALREAQNDAIDAKEKIMAENQSMTEGHKDFLTSASGVFEKFGKITSNAKDIAALVAPAAAALFS